MKTSLLLRIRRRRRFRSQRGDDAAALLLLLLPSTNIYIVITCYTVTTNEFLSIYNHYFKDYERIRLFSVNNRFNFLQTLLYTAVTGYDGGGIRIDENRMQLTKREKFTNFYTFSMNTKTVSNCWIR